MLPDTAWGPADPLIPAFTNPASLCLESRNHTQEVASTASGPSLGHGFSWSSSLGMETSCPRPSYHISNVLECQARVTQKSPDIGPTPRGGIHKLLNSLVQSAPRAYQWDGTAPSTPLPHPKQGYEQSTTLSSFTS